MICPIEAHQFLINWRSNLDVELFEKYKNAWIEEPTLEYFGFIPEEAKAIFIGTFPVPEFQTSGFFYHSDANLFWFILSIISGIELSTIESKLSWLVKNKMGITDVLLKVQRMDENCRSRADRDLKVIKYNNLYQLLLKYPNIGNIFLTSGGPSSKNLSGKSAGGWLGSHLREASKSSLKKLYVKSATVNVLVKPNLKQLNLNYLITPAPQDDQLGKYLKNNVNVERALNEISYLQNYRDCKLKYKLVQWATYLSKVPGLVHPGLEKELNSLNMAWVLMENKKSKVDGEFYNNL